MSIKSTKHRYTMKLKKKEFLNEMITYNNPE